MKFGETKRLAVEGVLVLIITALFLSWPVCAQDKGVKVLPAAASVPLLVDVGARQCIPCKMMAPILEELKKEYAGALQVEFFDVREDPGAAQKYGVRAIPTQIFYDSSGREFYRHMGFFSKEQILDTFKKHGVVIRKPLEAKK